jgi:ParB/RepB/Spo0J family partition protein
MSQPPPDSRKRRGDTSRFFRDAAPEPAAPDADLDFLLGGPADTDLAAQAAERGLPLLVLPVAHIAPDPQQLRRLPHVDELTRLSETGDRAAATLLAGLHELGQSLVEHGQVQPIVVYPFTDPAQPDVTHRIWNGQRRWSAALLAGLPTLQAIEMPAPDDVTRLLRQFEENERRAGFCDMERAWAISALREALHAQTGAEVPWTTIEARLHISDARRRDLLRLLRFDDDGQQLILRYGWSEWTLRALHMAINSKDLTPADATMILRALTTADEINAGIVARAMAAYRAGEQPDAAAPDMRAPSLNAARRMTALRRAIATLYSEIGMLTDETARETLRREAEELRASLDELITGLQ